MIYNSLVNNLLALNNLYNSLTRLITDILLSKTFEEKFKTELFKKH